MAEPSATGCHWGLLPRCAAADGRVERHHVVLPAQPRQEVLERLAPLAAAGAGAEGSRQH